MSQAVISHSVMNSIEAVQALMQNFTLEVVPPSAAKIERFAEHVRPGTDVYVTFLPGSDFAETAACAKRLADEGFKPIPHFAARSVPSKQHLQAWLEQVVGETGTDRALVIAGGVDKPVGDFSDSMQLLETGLFDRFGIKRIGVAGHPEGSPDMSDAAIAQALAWKNDFAQRSDADFYIVTQFAFDVTPIVAWEQRLRQEGNQLPIHIGVPGIATIKTLLKLAQASGVGPSIRFIKRQALNVAKLLTVSDPNEQVLALAHYNATHPESMIKGVHMYPLGGLRRTALWSYAVLDGKITPNAKGTGFATDVTY